MNKKAEKITLIIPIYNTENYLPACLESCMNQTLRDIEIVCINDGSPDKSQNIVSEYMKLDSRIRLINQENRGLPAARNAGIRQSVGKIIMFLDSDDFLSPTACERVWLEWAETKFDIMAFGCSLIPMENPAPGSWLINQLKLHNERFYNFSPIVLFDNKGAMPYICRQAYSRYFLKRIDLLFDEDVKYGEDLVFQMSAFPAANRFSFLSDHLYNYRWCRSGSLVNGNEEDFYKKFKRHLYMIEHICDYWYQKKWIDKYGSFLLQWMLYFIVPTVIEQDKEHFYEHFSQLQMIIDKYGFESKVDGMNQNHKEIYEQFKSYLNISTNNINNKREKNG